MDAFCNVGNSSSFGPELSSELARIKIIFTYAQVIFCVVGVVGNILNLRTLQSPSLQTVPFLYIRSMAVFDLIALSMIILHFTIVEAKTIPVLMFYITYIEAPIINTFLVAGLYSAFLLTIERYLLLSRPHTKTIRNPRHLARTKIGFMLLISAIIHLPMALQRTLKREENGNYVMANNVDLLCREPQWTFYSYYKLTRECLRFFCVILMTILNLIIARQLQLTKIRRRRLVRRFSPPRDLGNTSSSSTSTSNINSSESSNLMKKEYTTLMKSFTEKKLTVLMISICFIFILGNIPQMIVMVLQNEAMENEYGFQLYRYCSNLLEVVNHCLNFYVFCMASSEYTRAFLLNCMCLRNILLRFPAIARFLTARRSSSVLATTSAGFGVANQKYLSMESIAADNEAHELSEWVVEPESSPLPHQQETTLKGILVIGGLKEPRPKKSLTIINQMTDEESINKCEKL